MHNNQTKCANLVPKCSPKRDTHTNTSIDGNGKRERHTHMHTNHTFVSRNGDDRKRRPFTSPFVLKKF